MYRKRRQVHFPLAFHDFALMIDEDEIRNANLAEMHTKRIHPEMIQPFGVARGDVPRHAFIESTAREQAERTRKFFFPVTPLLGEGGENRRPRNSFESRFCFSHKSPPCYTWPNIPNFGPY